MVITEQEKKIKVTLGMRNFPTTKPELSKCKKKQPASTANMKADKGAYTTD